MYLLPSALLADLPKYPCSIPIALGASLHAQGEEHQELEAAPSCRDPEALTSFSGCCWHRLAPPHPTAPSPRHPLGRPSQAHCGGATQRGSLPKEEDEEDGDLGGGMLAITNGKDGGTPGVPSSPPRPAAGVAKLRP